MASYAPFQDRATTGMTPGRGPRNSTPKPLPTGGWGRGDLGGGGGVAPLERNTPQVDPSLPQLRTMPAGPAGGFVGPGQVPPMAPNPRGPAGGFVPPTDRARTMPFPGPMGPMPQPAPPPMPPVPTGGFGGIEMPPPMPQEAEMAMGRRPNPRTPYRRF